MVDNIIVFWILITLWRESNISSFPFLRLHEKYFIQVENYTTFMFICALRLRGLLFYNNRSYLIYISLGIFWMFWVFHSCIWIFEHSWYFLPPSWVCKCIYKFSFYIFTGSGWKYRKSSSEIYGSGIGTLWEFFSTCCLYRWISVAFSVVMNWIFILQILNALLKVLASQPPFSILIQWHTGWFLRKLLILQGKGLGDHNFELLNVRI